MMKDSKDKPLELVFVGRQDKPFLEKPTLISSQDAENTPNIPVTTPLSSSERNDYFSEEYDKGFKAIAALGLFSGDIKKDFRFIRQKGYEHLEPYRSQQLAVKSHDRISKELLSKEPEKNTYFYQVITKEEPNNLVKAISGKTGKQIPSTKVTTCLTPEDALYAISRNKSNSPAKIKELTSDEMSAVVSDVKELTYKEGIAVVINFLGPITNENLTSLSEMNKEMVDEIHRRCTGITNVYPEISNEESSRGTLNIKIECESTTFEKGAYLDTSHQKSSDEINYDDVTSDMSYLELEALADKEDLKRLLNEQTRVDELVDTLDELQAISDYHMMKP